MAEQRTGFSGSARVCLVGQSSGQLVSGATDVVRCRGAPLGLVRVSLSRLNHWLPRGETHPEIMEGTAEFHHEITDAVLPQPDAAFHDATALHTAVHVLDA